MFKVGGQTKICIDLPNGIYEFDAISGTGKTRLAKLLKELAVAGEPVMSYTYNDKVLGLDFDTVVKPGEQKLLVVDRYDLYRDEFNERINRFADTGVVLVDIKGGTTLKCDSCLLTMDKSIIKVER